MTITLFLDLHMLTDYKAKINKQNINAFKKIFFLTLTFYKTRNIQSDTGEIVT